MNTPPSFPFLRLSPSLLCPGAAIPGPPGWGAAQAACSRCRDPDQDSLLCRGGPGRRHSGWNCDFVQQSMGFFLLKQQSLPTFQTPANNLPKTDKATVCVLGQRAQAAPSHAPAPRGPALPPRRQLAAPARASRAAQASGSAPRSHRASLPTVPSVCNPGHSALHLPQVPFYREYPELEE